MRWSPAAQIVGKEEIKDARCWGEIYGRVYWLAMSGNRDIQVYQESDSNTSIQQLQSEQ
jgi:hypothetical protein